MAEVACRHGEGAQRRKHLDRDVRMLAADILDESLLGQQRERLQRHTEGALRWPVQGAGVAGGQHPDRAGAQRDGVHDARPVSNRTVDEMVAGDEHRRVEPGDGGAGPDRVDDRSGREPHGRTAAQVGGQDVQLDGAVRDVRDIDMFADQPCECPAAEGAVVVSDECANDPAGGEGEDVAPPQGPPHVGKPREGDRRHAVRSDPDGVESACRSADQQIWLDAGSPEGLQHADLNGPKAATTREHEGSAWAAACSGRAPRRGLHGPTPSIGLIIKR